MSSERILVVEDDQGLRDDLVMILEQEDYQVTACASGLEAVEWAQRFHFDLILSDIRMPGIDGLETIDRVLKSQPEVATLVITGFTDEDDSVRAVQLGVGDYLRKPFELHDLLAAVSRQLRRQRQLRTRRQREADLVQVANWALEQLATQLKVGVEPARLACSTAKELGLEGPLCAWIQLKVLVESCRRGEGQPPLDLGGLPGEFVLWLSELNEEDATPDLAGQIAQLVLNSSRIPEGDSVLGQAWERAQRRLWGGDDLKKSSPARSRLLQLARSQEHLGDSGAWGSYQALVAESLVDQEQVQGLLGLCRLAPDPEQCQQLAAQSWRCARNFNSLLACHTGLEVGHQLAVRGLKGEARSYYEQAGRLSRELAQPILESKAVLALSWVGVPLDRDFLLQALRRLLDHSVRFELLDGAWWLVPALLHLQSEQPHPLQEKALALLGRDAPTTFLRLIQKGFLSPEWRLSIVSALSGNGQPSARECLQLLVEDSHPTVKMSAEQALSRSSGSLSLPLLRISCLGPFEIYIGAELLKEQALPGPKTRFLLAYLAASSRPLSSERIIEEFWPDAGSGGRHSLNVCLSQLRKMFRSFESSEAQDLLQRDALGIQINPTLTLWHDLNDFNQLCRSQAGSEEEKIERWKRAVALYRGPYLDDCYMDWASMVRQQAEERAVDCLRQLLAALSAQQRTCEVLDYAQKLLSLDGCCQEAHLAVMKAHLSQGRNEAAIRQYGLCKRRLAQELKLEPNLALIETYHRALL